ncbi:nucleotidyltransferase domain-containing protein [Qipengyuania gaetbuli]|uniref:GSU2403 family nucleotidyltransferase fold protein n=1 Tax=Qipengyuania gaetbuli TaxID=266952 RepID=UPI001C998C69|nr:GSU2403 family nucleotidyltransferase fold protein [Qipengyuania gaetbuli]MBY6015098.1 nucleotidyltransferase domain-containing protein [Qipengyuania gaetbuli]
MVWKIPKAVDPTFSINNRRVDQVVPCRDRTTARIVAPDPRWFALHKLWLGAQTKRNPLKRRKDFAQGKALLEALAEALPQYNLGHDFAADQPGELTSIFGSWRDEELN